jgi:hypothetical protein
LSIVTNAPNPSAAARWSNAPFFVPDQPTYATVNTSWPTRW